MTNLLFLVLAVVIAAVGVFVLWIRTRGPRSVGSGVDDFARQMRAIAPEGKPAGGRDDTGPRRP